MEENITHKKIRLWTIQPLAVWKQLQRYGSFRCDDNLAKCMKDCEFECAYQWMAKQGGGSVNLQSA